MSRHRFDAVSFVFGALFTGVAVLGLTGPWSLEALDATWLGPGLLILLGLVVLATAVSRGRSPGEPGASAEEPGDDHPEQPRREG